MDAPTEAPAKAEGQADPRHSAGEGMAMAAAAPHHHHRQEGVRVMGWRDDFKVHPAADMAPMMEDEALARLGEDIKANALKYDIVLWRDQDGQEWLIDGRNRLEAMERAGVPLDPSRIWHVTCGDPYSWVLTFNAHRRHQPKQELADLIVKLEQAKADADASVSRQADVKLSKRGRAEGRKPDKVKAAAVASGKELGIGKSTIERAMAKAEGKTPKPTRHRRTNAQKERDTVTAERDRFLTFVSSLGVQNDIDAPKLSDDALYLLTIEQKADAVEVMESTITRLQKRVDRLRGLR
jgi:hypothetical protein